MPSNDSVNFVKMINNKFTHNTHPHIHINTHPPHTVEKKDYENGNENEVNKYVTPPRCNLVLRAGDLVVQRISIKY